MAATATADKRFPGGPANYDIVSFAIDFLTGLGAPLSPSNIGAVVAWANAESSGYRPTSSGGKNNPLNIVRTSGDGSSGQGGSQGNIADFPTPAAGAAATIRFFNYGSGQKGAILNALKSNAGTGAISSAVNAFYGQWGSGINFSGAPPIDPGTHKATAGGTAIAPGGAPTTATTAGVPLLDGASAVLGGLVGVVPGLSDVIKTAALPAQLAGVIIGVFANWRYVLELAAGGAMILVGVNLIVKDISGRGLAGRAVDAGKAAAPVAAVAA